MKATHSIIINGKLYRKGQEIPGIEPEPEPVPEPEPKPEPEPEPEPEEPELEPEELPKLK